MSKILVVIPFYRFDKKLYIFWHRWQ